jgi:hypothetical protein
MSLVEWVRLRIMDKKKKRLLFLYYIAIQFTKMSGQSLER